MEGKGFLQKAHSLVHCPKVSHNGVNQRDLNNYEKWLHFFQHTKFVID